MPSPRPDVVLARQPPPMDHRPVGVFDSGIGGLSILQALQAELPAEPFVYVADSGHAPYGERDDTHVIARTESILAYLRRHHHIKALVVACNTATAAAIAGLRRQHGDMALVGVEPALKPARSLTTTGVIGVLATQGTLASEKFNRLLAALEGPVRFRLQPCNGLAEAIEQATVTSDKEKTIALIDRYTTGIGPFGTKPGEIDTVVLGCTHYPLVADIIQAAVGPGVRLLEPGRPVARQLRRLLEESGSLHPARPHGQPGSVSFLSTGEPALLARAAQQWLGLGSASVQYTPIGTAPAKN